MTVCQVVEWDSFTIPSAVFTRAKYLLMFFFRLQIYLTEGGFFYDINPPITWTHIVLNYIGPNDGQGIQVYEDGSLTGRDTSKSDQLTEIQGDGSLVLGRLVTNADRHYSSVEVDELLLFNEALSPEMVYQLGTELCIPSISWVSPTSWNGPNPVVYRSFNEDSRCISFREGPDVGYFGLQTGKVSVCRFMLSTLTDFEMGFIKMYSSS